MLNDMPIGDPVYIYKPNLSNFFGFARAKIITPDNLKRPFLSTKTEDGKLIYPLGSFEGVYFSEVLLYALKLGYNIELIEGYQYERGSNIFNSYINDLYNKKKDCQDNGDIVGRTLYKLQANCFYGRFGMTEFDVDCDLVPYSKFEEIASNYPLKSASFINDLSMLEYEDISFDKSSVDTQEHDVEDQDEDNCASGSDKEDVPLDTSLGTKAVKKDLNSIKQPLVLVEYVKQPDPNLCSDSDTFHKLLLKSDNERKNRYISVGIAAAVTSYAQIHMYQFISLDDCVYTDTDSVVLKQPLPNEYVNDSLGSMKLENLIVEGMFLKPKLYYLKTSASGDTKTIIKFKGVPKDIVSISDFDTLYQGKSIIFSTKRLFKYKTDGLQSKTVSITIAPPDDSKRKRVFDAQGN
jgi:hypothetical protein